MCSLIIFTKIVDCSLNFEFGVTSFSEGRPIHIFEMLGELGSSVQYFRDNGSSLDLVDC